MLVSALSLTTRTPRRVVNRTWLAPQSATTTSVFISRLFVCGRESLYATRSKATGALRMHKSATQREPPLGLSIGDLSRGTGCKVQTIRYYEQIGLMPTPNRSMGNHRLYGRTHLHRLTFIRHSRELGFPLNTIRELLDLSDDPYRSCEQADRIAQAHLREVETRIASLTVLKTEFERMLRQCKRRRITECRVIEVLANHAECATEDHHARRTAAASLKPVS